MKRLVRLVSGLPCHVPWTSKTIALPRCDSPLHWLFEPVKATATAAPYEELQGSGTTARSRYLSEKR